MAEKTTDGARQKTGAKQAGSREERLKAALKANLGRRKAQARARRTGTETGRKED
ncbi:hypothetical protein [Pukyongiella litopenaei]|uniref:hypothetical protein n=1 Tax=Pukyongiella litopenaei TaxID=2605946 RepID=UPI001B801970|nr:hypothetical protein [Pukyongiella litopenaei]